jgi:hypothetical protein
MSSVAIDGLYGKIPELDRDEETKKKSHQAPVVRIAEILKHPNADTLGIVQVDGYQIVVKLGEFEVGDLAVYVQPDSVVPNSEQFAFMWAGRGFTENDEIPVKYRRVIPRKFRKEWSEGLLVQIPAWVRIYDAYTVRGPKEGDDLSTAMGISHYAPPEPMDTSLPRKQRTGWPRSLMGWWYWLLELFGFRPNGNTGGHSQRGPKEDRRVYDVEGFKNYPHVLHEGEQVIVTEKIHGSNARYTFEDGVMYVGSRTMWKSPGAKCVWRDALEQNPAIEQWCRAHPGYTLYGEVVPTQGDKFRYGTEPGDPSKKSVRFFLFDILGPHGWVPKMTTVNINNLWQEEVDPILAGRIQTAPVEEKLECLKA